MELSENTEATLRNEKHPELACEWLTRRRKIALFKGTKGKVEIVCLEPCSLKTTLRSDE